MWSFSDTFDRVYTTLINLEETMNSVGDPRIGVLPLMASPWPGVILCFLYLAAVILGQRIMKTKAALEIRGAMVTYNFTMVVINGALVCDLMRHCWFNGYSLRCQGNDMPRSVSQTV